MTTLPTLGALFAVVAILILSGCNHSDNSKNTTEYYEESIPTDPKVMVVDSQRLLHATLTDNSGQVATLQDNGTYRFEHNITFPVTAVNGYIDANNDGTVNSNEVINNIAFNAAEGHAVTLASTLASNHVMRTVLEEDFGLTSRQITSKTPNDDQDLDAFSTVLFDYMRTNGYTSVDPISEAALQSLTTAFTSLRNELEGETLTVDDVPVDNDTNESILPSSPERDITT